MEGAATAQAAESKYVKQVRISEDLHQKIAMKAIQERRGMSDLATDAINAYLDGAYYADLPPTQRAQVSAYAEALRRGKHTKEIRCPEELVAMVAGLIHYMLRPERQLHEEDKLARMMLRLVLQKQVARGDSD